MDASALLALLNQEPGSEAVSNALPGAAISAVNLTEVVAKLVEARMPIAVVRAIIEPLDLDVHSFDVEMAYASGALRAATKKLGLSLGDRACLALGRLMSRPVLTTDRAWAGLDLGVAVHAIR
jgi:PIN domain nuclease of toxin-antitoxin system